MNHRSLHVAWLAALALACAGCERWAFLPRSASPETEARRAAAAYLGRRDLGLSAEGLEPLDVVFLVHPRSPMAVADASDAEPFSRRQLFRHLTANVLSEVFHSAVEVRSEDDLREIESYRNLVLQSGKDPLWLLDPAALLLVDYRPAAGGVPGQLHLRLLDLQLARLMGLDYGELERDLANRRALVAEGYVEVAPFSNDAAMTAALKDAWAEALAEVLASDRYALYRRALEASWSGEPLDEKEAALVRATFFGSLPDELRPFNEDEGLAGFEERVKAIEHRVIFSSVAPAEAQAGAVGGVAPGPENTSGHTAKAGSDGAPPAAGRAGTAEPREVRPPAPHEGPAGSGGVSAEGPVERGEDGDVGATAPHGTEDKPSGAEAVPGAAPGNPPAGGEAPAGAGDPAADTLRKTQSDAAPGDSTVSVSDPPLIEEGPESMPCPDDLDGIEALAPYIEVWPEEDTRE